MGWNYKNKKVDKNKRGPMFFASTLFENL